MRRLGSAFEFGFTARLALEVDTASASLARSKICGVLGRTNSRTKRQAQASSSSRSRRFGFFAKLKALKRAGQGNGRGAQDAGRRTHGRTPTLHPHKKCEKSETVERRPKEREESVMMQRHFLDVDSACPLYRNTW